MSEPRQDVIDALIAFLFKNRDQIGPKSEEEQRSIILGRFPDLTQEEADRAYRATNEVLEAFVLQGLKTIRPAGSA